MNQKVTTKLYLLESSRLSLLEKLSKVDAQKLNTPPAIGKWSVAQVIYHLNQAEGNSVIYVSKKMKGASSLEKSGLKERLKMFMVKFGFLLPIKYKAPDIFGAMPDGVQYNEIVAEWAETRKRLKGLLATMPEDIFRLKVFKQPVAGMLDIYQMLDFMQVHFNRHLGQIERIVGN